jgi:hypothetical protein
MARGPEVRIATLATDEVERVELEQPRGALYGTGATSDLLLIHPGEVQARQFDIVAAGDDLRGPGRSPTWTSTSTTH